MKDFPQIADSEWHVMEVLWRKSPLTATNIIKSLENVVNWSPKTIHTLISRLVKKEVIGVIKEEPFFLYYPLVSEDECKNKETQSFLKKVYNGSIQTLVSNFVKQEKLTNEEIAELQRILETKKE